MKNKNLKNSWIWDEASHSYVPYNSITNKPQTPTYIKNLLYYILGIIGISILVYFSMFYNSDIAKENRALRKEIKEIKKQRDSIKDSLNLLENKYKKYQDSLDKKYRDLDILNKKLKDIEGIIVKQNTSLNNNLKEISDIKAQISNKEKNPPNRSGEDLINSLNKKLNNK